MSCKHKKWHPGKMVNIVGSDDQVWQEGFMEDTLELHDITMQKCSLCGELIPLEGVSATDIKRQEDGTRVITGFYR